MYSASLTTPLRRLPRGSTERGPPMAGSISKIDKTGKYRARYRDNTGKQHARHFDRRGDASAWLDAQTAALVSGRHVEPKTRKVTVSSWCERWLEHYTTANRKSTATQARTHVRR